MKDPSFGYLVSRSNVRIHVEWLQSSVLFQSIYHNYDDVTRGVMMIDECRSNCIGGEGAVHCVHAKARSMPNTGVKSILMPKILCALCFENCTTEDRGEKREGVQFLKQNTQNL